MAWPFQRGGKSSGNRKHSKIDKLPPEMKATVEEMILDGSATYTEIVDYLQEHGYSLSVSSVCRYAQGYKLIKAAKRSASWRGKQLHKLRLEAA